MTTIKSLQRELDELNKYTYILNSIETTNSEHYFIEINDLLSTNAQLLADIIYAIKHAKKERINAERRIKRQQLAI